MGAGRAETNLEALHVQRQHLRQSLDAVLHLVGRALCPALLAALVQRLILRQARYVQQYAW